MTGPIYHEQLFAILDALGKEPILDLRKRAVAEMSSESSSSRKGCGNSGLSEPKRTAEEWAKWGDENFWGTVGRDRYLVYMSAAIRRAMEISYIEGYEDAKQGNPCRIQKRDD